MPPPAPLRIGSPAFLVARPLDLGLEDEPGIDLVRAVPARLVEGLRDGSLDAALVSSIELFRREGYRYLDGPAVCGRGEVRSVQVFLRRPLEALRRVVLDPASRAAQALTRVVLPPRVGHVPEFLEIGPGQDPRAAAERLDADGWLAIGDAALRQALAADAPPSFSPSAAWTADTGLPFVFAVWITRPGLELDERALAAFAAARARGAQALETLAQQASREWGLPLAACRRYLLEECRYDPGEELRPALLAYRDAAAGLDLCRVDLEPEPIALPACRV
jgi:predicted solute-binding protein